VNPLPLALAAGLAGLAAPVPKNSPALFLVHESGQPKVIGLDGETKIKLSARSLNVSLSPGGGRVALLRYEFVDGPENPSSGWIAIRSTADDEQQTIPMAFGNNVMGTGIQFVWSRDGRRVLIVESGPPFVNGSQAGRAYRIYDLDSKKTTDVPVNTPAPADTWETDWSADGKRLLGQVGSRVAWLASDGKSPPEFITPEGESAYGGRLSPDGTRVLYKSKVEGIKYKWADYQLFVRDLRTGERTRITPDDGIADSFCWGPDGKRIAYTLRQAFEKPQEASECETRLVTDDATGGDRRFVTARKLTGKGQAGAIHFLVNDWR
jgi:Tol biopolymer transport system component